MFVTRTHLLLILGLVLAMLASLHIGLRVYGPQTVWAGLNGGTGIDELIITTLRLPRTLIGATCGGALGLSGLLMQAATRNPLAEPGLLGVNSGAALAAMTAFSISGTVGLITLSVVAMTGAALAVFLVFGLAMLGDTHFDPASVLLAGVTLAAMCSALTQVILISNERALEAMLFWLAGSFADREIILLRVGIPILIAGVLCALFLASSLDALRTDDNSAAALGVRVLRTRISALGLAAILAGTSVALAGPIMFIGLVAPHMARRIGHADNHARLVLTCVFIGALIAVLADILSRIIVAPGEAPVGTVLALIGVPALIMLLRRSSKATT